MNKSFINKSFFVLIIYVTLNACAMSPGQTSEQQSDLMSFSGLKEAYNVQETIKFWLHNNTDEVLWFSCALEKKIEGQWREVFHSIEEEWTSKKTILSEIKPQQSHGLSWDHRKLYSLPRLRTGIFRFRVEAFREKASREPSNGSLVPFGTFYSQEFKVVE